MVIYFKPQHRNPAFFSIHSFCLLSHMENELISHLKCEWRHSGRLTTVFCILCLLNEGNRCERGNMLRVLQYSRGTCREASLYSNLQTFSSDLLISIRPETYFMKVRKHRCECLAKQLTDLAAFLRYYGGNVSFRLHTHSHSDVLYIALVKFP